MLQRKAKVGVDLCDLQMFCNRVFHPALSVHWYPFIKHLKKQMQVYSHTRTGLPRKILDQTTKLLDHYNEMH